ncbi:MAG: DUF1214 domain-containing protein [Rhodocyclaceae bacterium]|nr:DUF1214 domain-containing protein [Rhodocyclaceae bacterium]
MTTAIEHPISMLRRITRAVLWTIAALVLGIGSAWWAVKKMPGGGESIRVGAWQANTRAGSADADMYTRAGIAVNALLALGRAETMYFVATTDDAGNPLRSRCTYRVSGAPPKARWWSITAYADDMFLFDAPNHHYSLNGTTASLDANGNFAFTTGAVEQAATYWLPTPGDRGVVLTLRLYNPERSLQTAPASLQAPSILAIGGCQS